MKLGNQTEAVALINQVRARKGVEMPAINSGPTYLNATTKMKFSAEYVMKEL